MSSLRVQLRFNSTSAECPVFESCSTFCEDAIDGGQAFFFLYGLPCKLPIFFNICMTSCHITFHWPGSGSSTLARGAETLHLILLASGAINSCVDCYENFYYCPITVFLLPILGFLLTFRSRLWPGLHYHGSPIRLTGKREFCRPTWNGAKRSLFFCISSPFDRECIGTRPGCRARLTVQSLQLTIMMQCGYNMASSAAIRAAERLPVIRIKGVGPL